VSGARTVPVIDLGIRPGSSANGIAVLALFDEAIEWLVRRGLVGQWGELPFSARPEMRERVQRMLNENEIRLAEHQGLVVGALGMGASPPYVPASVAPELYVTLLLSARRLAGNAIGARLLALAERLARDHGVHILRVDCWADAPRLVKFYERQGFAREGRFDLDGWHGQILSKTLAEKVP
jgi:RimJ/RimL family protein N-acetyltransferase